MTYRLQAPRITMASSIPEPRRVITAMAPLVLFPGASELLLMAELFGQDVLGDVLS